MSNKRYSLIIVSLDKSNRNCLTSRSTVEGSRHWHVTQFADETSGMIYHLFTCIDST